MKTAAPPMEYPFLTRRQLLERLERADRDPAAVRELIGILHRRYLDRAVLAPPAGWMASHIKLGEQIFTRLSSAECTAGVVAAGAALAKRYAKQLTRVLREDQIARQPGLALVGAVFGVRPSQQLDDGDDPYADRDDDGAPEGAPRNDPPVVMPTVGREPAVPVEPSPPEVPARRRGRPPGSKKVNAAAPRGTAGRRR